MDVPVPTTADKPKDLLDWATFEKMFVQSACRVLHDGDSGNL